jgi:hypothetical protein
MSTITKTRAVKAALIAAAMVTTSAVLAQSTTGGFGSNPSSLTGPSVGDISKNIAGSIAGVSSGFEAFLYFLGILFIVLFVLAAWKHKKSDGREGSMGLIATYLVLSACSFAAPTVAGSMIKTMMGSSTVTGVSAPSSTPSIGN